MFVPQRRRRPILWTSHVAAAAAANKNPVEQNTAKLQMQPPGVTIQEQGDEDSQSDAVLAAKSDSQLNNAPDPVGQGIGLQQSASHTGNAAADTCTTSSSSLARSWSPANGMFTLGLPISTTTNTAAVDPGRRYSTQHATLAAAAGRMRLGPFQLRSHVPCRFCSQSLSSSSNRLRHERLRHPVELERLQACEGRPTGRHMAGVHRRNASEAFEKITGNTAAPSSSCSNDRSRTSNLEPPVNVVELTQPLLNHIDQASAQPDDDREIPDRRTAVESDEHTRSNPSDSASASSISSANVVPVSEQRVTVEVLGPPGADQLHDSPSPSPCVSREELNSDSDCIIMIKPLSVEPNSIMMATSESSPRAIGESQIKDDSSSEYELECSSSTSESDTSESDSGSDTDMVKNAQCHAESVVTVATVPGARPLLQESQLDQAIKPLLDWFAQPPVTQCEALAKPKRVRSPSQIHPIRSNIRFIFALLYEQQSVETVDLTALARLDICQTLYESVKARGVGAGRMFAIFLLVKKCLVYLSSLESTRLRQFVQPTAFASFMYVDSICSDSSMQRKQQARNRMVLGAEAVAVLQNTSNRRNIESDHVVESSQRSQAMITIQHGDSTSAVAAAAASDSISSGCHATMTKDELKRVTVGCMAALDGIIKSGVPESMDQSFVHFLVTATLCLGLAPRSQILRQLQVGSTFVRQPDGRYLVRILAQMSKNGKPTMFPLAEELTPPYDAYLNIVRPRLLGKCADRAAASHPFVFFKRNGAAPRPDFGSSTTVVTQMLIGKAINPHSFRSSIITTFYETGATQNDMDLLANIMAHDPATARQFYYKPAHAQATAQTSRRMVEQLL